MQDIYFDPVDVFACPHCGQQVKSAGMDPFTPMTCPHCEREALVPGGFGGYLVTERVDDGLVSSLFLAHDPTLDRRVSLKILHHLFSKNAEIAEAFKREALAVAALNSPNVLKVYEYGMHNKQPFMVMEEIQGSFLNEVMRRERLSERRVLSIMQGVVRGLADTFERGIMLGDIMPRSILIAPDGTPKLCDFGSARFHNDQDNPALAGSSPYYMPPERIKREPEDHRGDFYSLGTTLYYLLCDELPFFDLEDEVVLRDKVEKSPPDPRRVRRNLTPEFAELTRMLLNPDPNQRPPTHETLFDLLEQVRAAVSARGTDTAEVPAPPKSKPILPRKRFPWGILVILLLGALCGWAIYRFTGTTSP